VLAREPSCQLTPAAGRTFAVVVIPSQSNGLSASSGFSSELLQLDEGKVGTYSSSFGFQGVQGTFEVTNPTVDHCSTCENTVLAYVRARTQAQNNTEIGWSEFGVADGGQYIYTYRSGDARYWYDSRLPVDVGEEATVRVRHCAGAGNLGVCTDVLWGTPDQFWLNVVLGNSDRLRCWNANQSGNCRGTAWVYAAWGDSTPPDLGGPLDVRNIRVRVDLHNWDLLSAANYGTGETTNDNGYCAHIVDHSWKYWATRAASC
jgi:hypothetical protein